MNKEVKQAIKEMLHEIEDDFVAYMEELGALHDWSSLSGMRKALDIVRDKTEELEES